MGLLSVEKVATFGLRRQRESYRVPDETYVHRLPTHLQAATRLTLEKLGEISAGKPDADGCAGGAPAATAPGDPWACHKVHTGPEGEGLGVDVIVYRADMKIKRRRPDTRVKFGGKRGECNGLSKAAARRMSFTIRNMDQEPKAFIHLTYPKWFPTDGDVCKRHLKRFRQCLRRRGIEDVWFMEFQERGAPHFHIITTDYVDKEWLSERWYEIVGSGDTKHLYAGTRVEKVLRGRAGMAIYAAKYAAKETQKSVPEGFENVRRMWGKSDGISCSPRAEMVGSETDCAPVIRAVVKIANQERKAFKREAAEMVKLQVGFCSERLLREQPNFPRLVAYKYTPGAKARLTRTRKGSQTVFGYGEQAARVMERFNVGVIHDP